MGSIPVILCILNLITQLILYIGPGLSRMNRGKAEDKVGRYKLVMFQEN